MNPLQLQIGPYLTEAVLGRGAMGIVYLARRADRGEPVALKILQLDAVELESSGAQRMERFHREIQATSSLQHPGIVQVLDSGSADVPGFGQTLYYAMEMIEGETLQQGLTRGAYLPEQATAVIVRLAEALQLAHDNGIVHRDIKPANVFVTAQSRVVLTDFGICKLSHLSTLTADGSLLGTIPFLAPEQFLEQPVDARTDIFALGALLYTLVAKRYLRPGVPLARLFQAVSDEMDVKQVKRLEHIDTALVDTIARAVARDPAARFQSAAEFAMALQPFATQVPSVGPQRQVVVLDDSEESPRANLETAPLDSFADDMGPTRPEPLRFPEELGVPGDTEVNPRVPSEEITAEGSPSLIRQNVRQQFFDYSQSAGGTPTAGPAPSSIESSSPFMVSADPLTLDVPKPAAPMEPWQPAQPEISNKPSIKRERRAQGVVNPDAGDLHDRIRNRLGPIWLVYGAVGLFLVVGFLLSYLLLLLRPIQLNIDSIPGKMPVSINGKSAGLTPVQFTSPNRRGQLTVEIAPAERRPFHKTVNLPLLGKLAPMMVGMPYLPAVVHIKSNPLDVSVFRGDSLICRTPCLLNKFKPREDVQLRLVKQGCLPTTLELRAEPDEQLSSNVEMKPLTPQSVALLQMLYDKRPHPIFLDGKDISGTIHRGTILLFEGQHQLQLGEHEEEKQMEIELPASSVLRVDLRQKPTAPSQPRYRDKRKKPTPQQVVNYGLWLLSKNKPSLAKRHFEIALQHNALDPNALRAMIITHVALDEREQLEDLLRTYLRLPALPDDARTAQDELDLLQGPPRCR